MTADFYSYLLIPLLGKEQKCDISIDLFGKFTKALSFLILISLKSSLLKVTKRHLLRDN